MTEHTDEAHHASILTTPRLAEDLRRIADNVRFFTPDERAAKLHEAARRLHRPTPIIDPEDFVAVEPSDRVYDWNVVLYDADEGKPVIVKSFGRKEEADALQQTIADLFVTWIKELRS